MGAQVYLHTSGVRGLQRLSCLKYYDVLKLESKFTLKVRCELAGSTFNPTNDQGWQQCEVKEANMPWVNLNGCISWSNNRTELKIEPHIPWSLVHYACTFFLLFWSYFSHKKLKSVEMLPCPCRTQEGNMAYGVLCVKWYWKWQHIKKWKMYGKTKIIK